jgi:hypothetical protein
MASPSQAPGPRKPSAANTPSAVRTSIRPQAEQTARISITRGPFDSVTVRDEYAILSVERYVLHVWRTQVVREGVLAYTEALRRMAAECRQCVGGLVYFLPGVSVAHPPDVRRELVHCIGTLRGLVGASAVVREGGGFPAAVLRSSITSMQLEQGTPESETAFFTDIAPAAEWLVRALEASYGHVALIDRGVRLLVAERFDVLADGCRGA